MTEADCITCGDLAVTGRVTELLGQGMATAEVGGLTESVSVELVDAHVGDLLLVHARVAIGKFDERT